MARMERTLTDGPPRSVTRQQDDAHTLPGWVNIIQDNLFLSFLILAEAYLLGTLMTLGWVADIEAPSRWGTYHGVGVVLFFLAGAMAAGVALRCSVKAAGCFSRHQWGMALFNFVGLVLFSGAEIWASLSERSANLRPTPADTAVLSLLGVSSAPISPTVVVVAFLLPFASLYYGFSQQHRQRRETDEERAEQERAEDFALRRKLARAEAAARLRCRWGDSRPQCEQECRRYAHPHRIWMLRSLPTLTWPAWHRLAVRHETSMSCQQLQQMQMATRRAAALWGWRGERR